MIVDLVVGSTFATAREWCHKNGLDLRMAASMENAAIRLKGTRGAVVKLVGDVDEFDASEMRFFIDDVESRGGSVV